MLDDKKPAYEKNANHASTAPAYFSAYDIHAYYGESYIVQGVTMNIHEGEILALLGRNGAGKTSTLRAIARLDNPMMTQGEVWLDHQPLHQMKSYEASQAGIEVERSLGETRRHRARSQRRRHEGSQGLRGEDGTLARVRSTRASVRGVHAGLV